MPRGVHDNHPTGPAHGRWKGGKKVHHSGYVYITAGKFRGWTEHKMVMYLACQERCYYTVPDMDLPAILEPSLNLILFHVHHMDGNKQNNQLRNLLLVDERIHYGHNLGGRHRDENTQRFIARAEAVRRERTREKLTAMDPDWVTKPDESEDGWEEGRE